MADPLVSLAEIRAAAARIANIAVRTPLVRTPFPGLSGHGVLLNRIAPREPTPVSPPA
jgi:hypothetical protein